MSKKFTRITGDDGMAEFSLSKFSKGKHKIKLYSKNYKTTTSKIKIV